MTASVALGIGVWLLTMVFSLSGFQKLRRPMPAALAMVNFGIIGRPRAIWGTMLGWLEIGLAFGLASGVRVRLTLAAATALLVLFTFMLGSALSRGKRFACACFGDIAKPLSGRTLGRTALLALIAFTALVAADGDAGLWVTDGIRAEALEAVIAGALLGITVLASRMADLWRWNASPYPTIRERL